MTTPLEDDIPRLSIKDLAQRYQISEATVHAWMYAGTAPRSYKIGRHRRFKLGDVVAWEEQRASPKPGGEISRSV